ncbi:MAG: TonB-dependent receptor, partial [Steroidobacteraceae bacterium]
MNIKQKMTLRVASATLLSAGLASGAHAQVETRGLEEIIVTARKVEENLQETPIAITALSGGDLEDRQVFNTNVLDQVVPNLQFADN